MSLLLFVAVAMAGAILTLAARARGRPAAVIGVAGLLVTTGAALAIEPGQAVEIAGTGLSTTAYVREFLVLGSVIGLGLGLAGVVAGTRRDAPATTLAILATGALTLGLRDPQAAVIVAAAGGLFGILVTLAPGGGLAAATVGIREARIVIVAGVLSIGATAWFGREVDGFEARRVVLGLAYLAFALAVAMRFGAIPFHLWAARLADTVPETALPVVTALAPASLAIVALAWTGASTVATSGEADAARLIVLGIAGASIVLGALAALVQDDIEHVLGYSIVADSGVILLAVAALDPVIWGPARTWILVFVAGRGAFAAWAAGVRVGFWTGSLDDLHGWARRSPILGGVLGAVIIASVGVPGMAVFDSRLAIVNGALGGVIATLILLATLAPVAYLGRLLVVGLRRPEEVARPADDWLPRLPARDRSDLVAWLRAAARLNRAFGAAILAVVLVAVSLATSVGLIGDPAAAAEPPPVLERPAAVVSQPSSTSQSEPGETRSRRRLPGRLSVRSEDPVVDVALVVEQLRRVEPQSEFVAG